MFISPNEKHRFAQRTKAALPRYHLGSDPPLLGDTLPTGGASPHPDIGGEPTAPLARRRGRPPPPPSAPGRNFLLPPPQRVAAAGLSSPRRAARGSRPLVSRSAVLAR